jgi:hypothetical protein
MRTRSRGPAVVLLLGLAALSGCSQAAALAPVGGDRIVAVRVAAINVLLSQGVEFVAAPTCSAGDDSGVTCDGQTEEGLRIKAHSSSASPGELIVAVGEEVVYDDDLDAALERDTPK